MIKWASNYFDGLDRDQYSALVAILIAAVLCIFIFMLAQQQDPGSELRNAMVGFAVGLPSSAMVVLFFTYAHIWRQSFKRQRRKKHFSQLFGTSTLDNGVILLFAHRKSTEVGNDFQSSGTFAAKKINDIYRDKDVVFAKKFEASQAEGITSWIPFQDFKAANYVAAEVAQITSKTSIYRTDESVDYIELDAFPTTIVSFGLGFNYFSHTISELTQKKLFEIIIDKSDRLDSALQKECKTDNFRICGFGDFPQTYLKEGGLFDFALVARIVINSAKLENTRYFFICAGRTASGTSAAGFYLANKWEEILDLYMDKNNKKSLEKDSIVIALKHFYGHGSKTHAYGRDCDSDVRIATICDESDQSNTKKIIQWWRNPDEQNTENNVKLQEI